MKYFTFAIQLKIAVMKHFLPVAGIILVIIFTSSIKFVRSQDHGEKLKIGVKSSPPFVIIDSTGIHGLSTDLWDLIAMNLEKKYDYVRYDDLGDLLQAIADNDVDLCINPLTVTHERLKKFSFSQPYYISNLGIAVRAKEESNLTAFIRSLFSRQFIEVVFLLFMVILVFGFVIWLAERKRNPDHFSKGWRGLGDGLWWSAVTMTTVGYGDKAPRTGIGRLLSVIWMFTAVIIISSFTAGISAALTFNKLQASINSIDDLRNVPVGTVKNSSSAEFLVDRDIAFIRYETLQEAMNDLNNKKIKAVVYDEPLLSYLIYTQKLDDKIMVIPSSINSEYFSFASANHKLLRKIDPLLIEFIESDNWNKTLDKYRLKKH